MEDLTAIRMFHLENVPDTPFSVDDEKALAAVILRYAYTEDPHGPDGYRLTSEECIYLLETLGYDVGTLKVTKRQLLACLLPHYSMASKYPHLVSEIYQVMVNPRYHRAMLLAFDKMHA